VESGSFSEEEDLLYEGRWVSFQKGSGWMCPERKQQGHSCRTTGNMREEVGVEVYRVGLSLTCQGEEGKRKRETGAATLGEM
jgi:hypothetical protein